MDMLDRDSNGRILMPEFRDFILTMLHKAFARPLRSSIATITPLHFDVCDVGDVACVMSMCHPFAGSIATAMGTCPSESCAS